MRVQYAWISWFKVGERSPRVSLEIPHLFPAPGYDTASCRAQSQIVDCRVHVYALRLRHTGYRLSNVGRALFAGLVRRLRRLQESTGTAHTFCQVALTWCAIDVLFCSAAALSANQLISISAINSAIAVTANRRYRSLHMIRSNQLSVVAEWWCYSLTLPLAYAWLRFFRRAVFSFRISFVCFIPW